MIIFPIGISIYSDQSKLSFAQLIVIWNKTSKVQKQDYVHKHNMSAFCEYDPKTKKIQDAT